MSVTRLNLPRLPRARRRPPDSRPITRGALRRIHQILVATILLDALDFSFTLWRLYR